jgi:regulator of protease activity HflC (stomatin/prohibitin superfamily)
MCAGVDRDANTSSVNRRDCGMSTKAEAQQAAEDAKRAVLRTAEDAKDTVHEAAHRAAAEAERAKRKVAGDHMNLGDRARSVGNEAKQDIEADVAATKRSLREGP